MLRCFNNIYKNHASNHIPLEKLYHFSSEAHTQPSGQHAHASDVKRRGIAEKNQQGDYFYVRIAPKRQKYASLWTAHDILSFLADPALRNRYLSVEYDKSSLLPRAWWVMYKEVEKRNAVVRGLRGDGKLGTTDVIVTGDNPNTYMQRNIGVGRIKYEGKRVLMECGQEMLPEMIEDWFQKFQLADRGQRIAVFRKTVQQQFGGPPTPYRAIVRFSDPAEAELAVMLKHKEKLNGSQVRLRLMF
ncbi:hypothetical protein CEUSTIGMA_g8796.t1 [Chlamydomonas eustigma]|uniref:RRM domain-containing protein n=1 Tax=Chlamydomonas eustigma TaxID=1157962 RepID=A0A250XE60_9CHLO|nr:hypothetical protein CEUSTIGMA_g8796.t1 [Chlamydomonas eustigma]|eukprot:GAX81365.1 hypothetical protein CEUSTIGMA_g8796.t1 [Chlamydomonas eustigma]